MTTPSLVPRGPWTDRAEVEQILGPPVERRPVALRHRGFGWLLPVVLLAPVGCCVLTMAIAVAGGHLGNASGPGLEVVGVLASIGLFVFALRCLGAWFANRDRALLVGRDGLAEWRSTGATIALWEDLGIHWLTRRPNLEENERKDVLLVLEHASGVPLKLLRTYVGVQEVADRIDAAVRRNRAEQAALLDPPGAGQPDVSARQPTPPSEPVPDFAFPPVEDGPWLDSTCGRMVGPVLLVAGPTPAARRRWFVWAVLGSVGLALFGGGMAALAGLGVWRLGRGDRDVERRAVVVPLVAGCLAFGLIPVGWKRVGRELRTRWLLGEKGVAYWSEPGEFVALWDDLGDEWRPSVHVGRAERYRSGFPVLLKLVHRDGARLYFSAFYEHARYFVARVRAVLDRREGEGWSGPEPRPGGSDNTRPRD